MALHLDGTYFMPFLDADASNRTLPLTDISNSMNLSSNNSTLNNTEAKKIAALARHHRFQAEVTPRTAIRNFVDANQSEAQISSPRIRIRKSGPKPRMLRVTLPP